MKTYKDNEKEITVRYDEKMLEKGTTDLSREDVKGDTTVTEECFQQDVNETGYRSKTIKLNTKQPPYLPDGLIWYNAQPQWQSLAKSRLDGNMQEYSKTVSGSQTKFVSTTEEADIKASAKQLWITAHGEVDENLQVQFKVTTETLWKVEAHFAKN